ncbi:hypothetical protein GCM10009678_05160 [Actinomadura kijaniata]|uniref:Uncharacterized protein n=1 Tax=Actinomadura namibiensis TaxID=182080 RepID=A0A7W3QNR6_ACTNM|nr:hypothetical protein [Actinomadura namibiensis]MBA8953920.1 hypothetical protein [Actinomadura namibiensis]
MILAQTQEVNAVEIWAAVGQWAGAIAAAGAAIVALIISGREGRRQRRAEAVRALAQARLVEVDGPAFWVVSEGPTRSEVRALIVNHGAQPIINVHAELWPVREDLNEPARFRAHAPFIRANDTHRMDFEGNPVDGLVEIGRAARVRWSDAEGNQWQVCLTEQGLQGPEPFTGQLPTPYRQRRTS